MAYLNHCEGSGLFTYTPLRIAQGDAARYGAVQNLLHGTLVRMISFRVASSCKFILHNLHSWSPTSIASFLLYLLPFIISIFPTSILPSFFCYLILSFLFILLQSLLSSLFPPFILCFLLFLLFAILFLLSFPIVPLSYFLSFHRTF